jgi:hypothetical protein
LEKKKKIGRFGSAAGGAPFGRQPLHLNQTTEREAESAADQAPLNRENDLGKPVVTPLSAASSNGRRDKNNNKPYMHSR